MKPFARSILFTGVLAMVATSSMVAQTSNGIAIAQSWAPVSHGRDPFESSISLRAAEANRPRPGALISYAG